MEEVRCPMGAPQLADWMRQYRAERLAAWSCVIGERDGGEFEMEGWLPARPQTQSAVDGGVGFRKIVAWTGLLLAGALYMVDPLEPFSYSAATIFSQADDRVTPSSLVESEINEVAARPDASTTNDGESALLFGMNTEPVTDGSLLNKWRRAEAGITRDLEITAQCRANQPCPAPAKKLVDLSLEGTGRGRRARVGLINRAVDLAISPVSDEIQWGVPDYWSNPLETLRSNRGDCEDFAIVKYAALLEAGIPKDDVKIVILKTLFPKEDHAVVAARVDGQWLLLDNRTLTLVRDTDVTRAIPEFVLDYEGVKRFNWASQNGERPAD
jgi:predicted transglutaminase-like cysteine proteinase